MQDKQTLIDTPVINRGNLKKKFKFFIRLTFCLKFNITTKKNIFLAYIIIQKSNRNEVRKIN